jgi:hypothetical protein
MNKPREILNAYQEFGAGDRLRLLDRCGIPRSVVSELPPHIHLDKVTSIVASNTTIRIKFWTAVAEMRGE